MDEIYCYYVLLLVLLLLAKYKFYTAITTILIIHDKCMINNIMIELFIYAWIDGASSHCLYVMTTKSSSTVRRHFYGGVNFEKNNSVATPSWGTNPC